MKKIFYGFVLFLFLGNVSCEKADLAKTDPVGNETGDTVDVSGSDTTSSSGSDEEGFLTVRQFLACGDGELVHVRGYIVGSCERNISNADFSVPFKGHTAILLADKQGEKDCSKIMVVGLKTGKTRNSLNLEGHPELYGRFLDLDGYKGKYLYTKGIKPVDLIDWKFI